MTPVPTTKLLMSITKIKMASKFTALSHSMTISQTFLVTTAMIIQSGRPKLIEELAWVFIIGSPPSMKTLISMLLLLSTITSI